eukprot:9657834-Prorocentrum_lima.AAC.1
MIFGSVISSGRTSQLEATNSGVSSGSAVATSNSAAINGATTSRASTRLVAATRRVAMTLPIVCGTLDRQKRRGL